MDIFKLRTKVTSILRFKKIFKISNYTYKYINIKEKAYKITNHSMIDHITAVGIEQS